MRRTVEIIISMKYSKKRCLQPWLRDTWFAGRGIRAYGLEIQTRFRL